MKKFAALAVAMAACSIYAYDAVKVGDYTYTNSVIRGKAIIGNGFNTAITPKPTGVLTIPGTLGGAPVGTINDWAFNGCENLTDVIVPDSVETIGSCAFSSCPKLANVTLGVGVKTVSKNAFQNSGFQSDGTYQLEKVVFRGAKPEGAEAVIGAAKEVQYRKKYESQYGTAVPTEKKGASVVLDTPEDQALASAETAEFDEAEKRTETSEGALKLKGKELGGATKVVSTFTYTTPSGKGTLDFWWKASTVLPDSANVATNGTAVATVPSIGGVTDWTHGKIILAADEQVTVTWNYEKTASDTSGTEDCIWVDGIEWTETPDAATEIVDGLTWKYLIVGDSACIGDGAPGAVTPAPSGALTIPAMLGDKPVTAINQCALSGLTGITGVTIPDSVTELGVHAFEGCTKLANVTLGDGVEIIDAGAFDGCTGITTVTIPQGVCNTTLAEVFPDAYATKIGTVTISDAVTSLGEGLFAGCTGLASVTIPANVTAIGDGAFDGCTGLTTVTLGDGLEEIGDDAFKGCTGITTVTIPQVVCSSTLAEVFPDAYATKIGTVTISETVKSIGDNAFTNCTSITSVKIPDGVTKVGESAFEGCSALASVTIGSGVPSIGAKAFKGTALTSVTIPGNVTEVGESAFEGRTTLIELILNEGVEKIGTNAFNGCTGLTSVVIPASVTEIGEGAFDGCAGIDSVTIAPGATTIGKGAFAGCKTIKHVAIPNTVTEIGEGAFDGCTALNSVTFGSAVETIGEKAFEGCTALTSVTVPASVKTIGTEAFKGCTILANVTLNEGLETIGDNAFEGCTAITGIEIPASVTAVGADAFAGCGNLEGVLLREGLEELGEGAFTNCVKLLSITVPDSVTAIGAGAFADCGKLGEAILGAGITEIPDNAFKGCTALKSITVPDGVTAIGVSAFEGCTALATVDLGLGVVTLGDNAFKDCTALTGISVPDSTETIGKSAFEDCGKLMVVTLGDSVETIDDGAFKDCVKLMGVTMPDSVVKIGDEAFKDCTDLATVNLGDGLEEIGTDAFDGCGAIKTVTIPQGVCNTTLAEVFPDAYTGITKVTISDNILYMDASPFGGCGAIKDVTIPQVVCSSTLAEVFPTYGTITTVTISEVVSSIGDNAFKGCEKLTSVTIPDGVTKVGESAFEGCSALASVTIGSGVPSIGAKAFKGCTVLTSVTIPDGVTAIGDEAFYGCTALAAVTIGEGVRSIGTDAFKNIYKPSSVLDPICVVKLYGSKPEGADALITQLSADGNKVSYRRKYESEYGLKSDAVFDSYIEITIEDEVLGYGDAEYDTTEKRTETSEGSIKLVGKGNDTTAKASYKVGGRGTLTFWWKASTEYESAPGIHYGKLYDYGYVSCGDAELSGAEGSTEVKNIGGNTGWTQATWVNNTGAKYVTWNYKKDDSDEIMTGIQDCIWIDGIEWTPDPRQDALGVDVPLEFEDNDNPNWEVVDCAEIAHPGKALRSGPIGHNESNWVQITKAGSFTVYFWVKVSSEAGKGFARDGARFYIDDVPQEWSTGETLLGGEIGWVYKMFSATGEGNHTLKWEYVKDDADRTSTPMMDCMWLDDVTFGTPLAMAAAPKLLSAGTTRALLAVSSDADAQAAVSGFDFADGSVAENVDTAAEYNALGNWAKANDLGRQELRTSGTVYDSFTLAADGLIEEIAISEMEGAAGELTVKVQVSDANGDAVAVAGEKVAQMVQVSGVLGDWQEPEQVEYVGEKDGKLVFKVTTGIEGDGVFVRIKQ